MFQVMSLKRHRLPICVEGHDFAKGKKVKVSELALRLKVMNFATHLFLAVGVISFILGIGIVLYKLLQKKSV